MSALDRLELKLSSIRHVRDVGYWHLPYGTPLIAHPKLAHLSKAPIGSQASNSKRQKFTKTGPDEWKSTSGKTYSNAELMKSNTISQLAPPERSAGGAASQGAKFGEAKKGKFQTIGGPGSHDLETLEQARKRLGLDKLSAVPDVVGAVRPPTEKDRQQHASAGDKRKQLLSDLQRESMQGDTPASRAAAKAKLAQELEKTPQYKHLFGTPKPKKVFKPGDLVQADQGGGTRYGGKVVKHEGSKVTVEHSNLGAPGTHKRVYHVRQVSAETPRDAEHRAKAEQATKVLLAQEKIKGPLNDQQYEARINAIDIALKAASHLSTELQHRRFGAWDPERKKQHDAIVADLLERKSFAKRDHKMIIAGGLGGAGKSTVLSKHVGVVDADWLTVNPDDVKEEMAKRGMVPDVPGLSPMERSALVHEESGDIANQLLRQAEAQGFNIIQDITMSSTQTIDRRLREAHDYGYSGVHGVFVDIPVETSVTRALARHRRGLEDFRKGKGFGGRYVPPSIIRRSSSREYGSINRHAFEQYKKHFGSWEEWDNAGDAPKLMGRSGKGRKR